MTALPVRRVLAAGIGTVLTTALATVVMRSGSAPTRRAVAAARIVEPPATTTTSTTTSTTTTTTTIPPPTTTAPVAASFTLAGCPPPAGPHPPPPTPWHPAVLVPESSLPPEQPPAPWTSSVAPISGKGMWVWLWNQTERGDPDAIVQRAVAAGLHQLWVRVADSQSGFYGGAELAALVGRAHAAGVQVVAWGFPYLYDPVGDANWTSQVLDWRSPTGDQVDGYSADIERSTEGVALTERRVAVYLQLVRKTAGNRVIVATVYPPLDAYWSGGYPYGTISRYVDAFAPMIYWECTDPGADALAAISRLGRLRPVHLIGQAFSMADDGGRIPAPSGAEITRFLHTGEAGGAVGASFWVWQSATAEEWGALTAYRWTT